MNGNDPIGHLSMEQRQEWDRNALHEGMERLHRVFPHLSRDGSVQDRIEWTRMLLEEVVIAIRALLRCSETKEQATKVAFDVATNFCRILWGEWRWKSPFLKGIAAEQDSSPMIAICGARKITGGDPSVSGFLDWVELGERLYPNPKIAKRGSDRACQEAAEWILHAARLIRSPKSGLATMSPEQWLRNDLALAAALSYPRFLDIPVEGRFDQSTLLKEAAMEVNSLPEPQLPLTNVDCLRAWQDWVCKVFFGLFTSEPASAHPGLFRAKVDSAKKTLEKFVQPRRAEDLIEDAIRKAVKSAFRCSSGKS